MSKIIDIRQEADLTEWTAQVSDDCTWSASAALAGSVGGMLVTLDDATATYMYKTVTTNTSGKLRVRFYIDPNTLTMTSGDSFWTVSPYSASVNPLAIIKLEKVSSNWLIAGTYYYDGGNGSFTASVITDAAHYVELNMTRATNSTSLDGVFTLWIDDTQINTVTNLDNYDQFDSFATLRAGALAGIDAGTSGTFFLDEFVANDDGGYIGPRGFQVNIISDQTLGDLYIY